MSTEVGNKLSGTVTGITKFGAFVKLPDGKTGLVHISEVDDRYVEDIKEILKVGDEVTVKVINVADDGKIGLSIRKAKEGYRPRGGGNGGGPRKPRKTVSFEDKLSRFLKDSEENIATIKRQTESKRGGRGARRG
ncbi:MAG TPA: S1 domain-containing RNA-binding protein [Bacillales bacterium]|nr:S1 domain-containing RNA-binding protein [Bacillales bacterium]